MTAPRASIDPTKNPTKLTITISYARNSNPLKNVSHHLKTTAKDRSKTFRSVAGSVSLCKRSLKKNRSTSSKSWPFTTIKQNGWKRPIKPLESSWRIYAWKNSKQGVSWTITSRPTQIVRITGRGKISKTYWKGRNNFKSAFLLSNRAKNPSPSREFQISCFPN